MKLIILRTLRLQQRYQLYIKLGSIVVLCYFDSNIILYLHYYENHHNIRKIYLRDYVICILYSNNKLYYNQNESNV